MQRVPILSLYRAGLSSSLRPLLCKMASTVPTSESPLPNRPRRGGSRRGGFARNQSRPYPRTQETSSNFVHTQLQATAPAGAARMVHNNARPVMVQPQVDVPVAPRSASPTTNVNNRHFSEKRFADAPISKESKAGIKHEFMTDVQAATIDLALEGHDLLVQARTGTGKTIGFLLPAIEHLTKAPKQNGISILVLAPTRELALQIEKEAEGLLGFHNFKVQHAIGGTNQKTESKRLNDTRCDILIATPGRLIDHLQSSSLRQKLTGLKTIVYDEADRLLDQGFRRDLDVIASFLPPKDTRQALLFSATVSDEIKKVAAGALRPGYRFVSTLLEDEVNTHEHVEQTYIITPQTNFIETTIDVLKKDLQDHMSAGKSTSKCIVFFPTARQVAFAAELLREIPGLSPVLEIHSRKSQPARIRAAEEFKTASTAVLMSSDVAARGVDFPGVTLVLQVGLPANGEQYIHRLGRTARAGAAGRGIIILSREEQFFLRSPEITELGLKPSTPPPPTSTSISQALAKISLETKAQAYRAFLGYYNTHVKHLRLTKEGLVQYAFDYAVGALGWPGENGPPGIEPRTLGKMNLRGVKGIKEERREDTRGNTRGGGRGGRSGA